MKEGKKLIAVLPAYNAEKTLELTLADIPKDLFDEIILVDDCSRDGTVALARRLGLKVFVHEKNMGYGGNQKTCYREALASGADIVVMIHPDYQYDPTLAPDLVAPILAGQADCVLGSRMMRDEALKGKMPLWKYIGNKILTGIENMVFGQRYSEYHTGYRAYSRKVLETLPLNLNSDGFVFDQQIIAQMLVAGFHIAEVPIPTRYFKEASSVSFLVSVKYGLQTIGTLGRYFLHRRLGVRFRQFKMLGLLLILFGGLFSDAVGADGLFVVDSQAQWQQGSGEFIDYWTKPGSIRPYRGASSDYFDSSTLSPFWTWSPSGAGNSYDLNVREGWLRLISAPLSEWWDETDKAPKLFQTINGDFDMQITMQDDRPTHDVTFAGLFIKKDSENRIEIGIGGTLDGAIHTRETLNGESRIVYSHTPTLSPVDLRITRSGQKIRTFYKDTDDSVWNQSWEFTTSTYQHYDVGFYSYDLSYSSYVEFNDFIISQTSVPPASVEYLSAIFDQNSPNPYGGKISFIKDSIPSTTISIHSRTSPDAIQWSEWSPQYLGGVDEIITSPNQRFIQFHVLMSASESAIANLDYVSIYYPPEPVYGEFPVEKDRVHAVPHPIRDRVATIQYDILAPVSEVIFEFMDQGGRRVERLTAVPAVGANQLNWNTSGLANGLYFLKISARSIDGKVTSVTKKLAIVR